MTDWREHLTPEEAKRLEDIADEKRALSREARRIFDRARKRVVRQCPRLTHERPEHDRA